MKHPTIVAPAPAPAAFPAAHPLAPTPRTSFVGRERELLLMRQLLGAAETSFVTLTGPGGVGKTRLALEAVAGFGDTVADEVRFVDLSHIHDPALVLPVIVRALDLKGDSRSVAATLTAVLRGRRLLLVLDNFEQVLEAAVPLTQMLEDVPGIKVLVTSRATLRLSNEHVVEVSPLKLPAADLPLTIDQAAGCEAVRLFADRVRAFQPGFTLTSGNLQAVIGVCRRLDGLPLAIELAAVWSPILSPQALLIRLDRHLPLLDAGPVDTPARHRTMRDTVAWSYGLLDDTKRALFRRLAVFAGGTTLAGAAVVGGMDTLSTIDTLHAVAALVHNSLLRQEPQPDGEPRFLMLDTIREYGLEQLAQNDEDHATHLRHAAYVLAFAERAESALIHHDQDLWLDRLESEQANFRAALAWTIEQREDHLALRLAGSLWTFWRLRFHAAEGRGWLERVLALNADAPANVMGKVLLGAGTLAWAQGDYGQAQTLLDQALARLDDAEETILYGRTLLALGRLAWDQEETEIARTRFEEAHRLFENEANDLGMAHCLHGLGLVAQSTGELQQATALLEEALDVWRSLGLSWGLACCIPGHLGDVARAQGHLERADSLYREGLALNWRHKDPENLSWILIGLAAVAVANAQAQRAASLIGLAEAIRESIAAPFMPAERYDLEHVAGAARTQLGAARFAAAHAAGRAQDPARGIQDLLNVERGPADPVGHSGVPHGLTPRELQVLRLLAGGASNQGIAETLFISTPTVKAHVTNILAKLALDSRTAAASYAHRHGLAWPDPTFECASRTTPRSTT